MIWRPARRRVVVRSLDGGTIRVGDVATVVDGFEDNPILATLNGKPAVLLQVMTTETMDIVKASESIRTWIDERQATLPEGAKLTLWTDNAEDFNSRMKTIGNSAAIAVVVVPAARARLCASRRRAGSPGEPAAVAAAAVSGTAAEAAEPDLTSEKMQDTAHTRAYLDSARF